MNTTPTPGELLGEILTSRHLANMAWDVYMKRLDADDEEDWRDIWGRNTDKRANAEHRLYERMRKDRLAQVTTAGFKARIEYHANSPCVTIYRTTENGEERVID